MAVVVRLVTDVELDAVPDPDQVSVSARLSAALDDGRALVLLDDRGWGSSGKDVRAHFADNLEPTARMVVGPDEPPPGRTHDEEAALHWQAMADRLREHGVTVEGAELAALRHDVVLGDRLRGWLAV